jgi:hypothetical protein
MRCLVVAVLLGLGLANASIADECNSLVKSVCGDQPANESTPTRRVLKVEPKPPEFATGDIFPMEDHSLLMNPTRYKLPKVDGPWRYYALDGVVYRVDIATAKVLQVINDNRTWSLR